MKYKTGISLAVVVIILALVFLAITQATTNNTANISQSPTVTTPLLPAGWQQYTNSEYRFNYPKQATINTDTPDTTAITFMGEKQKASGRTQTELFDGYSVAISKLGSLDTKSLQQYAEEEKANSEQNCIRDDGVISNLMSITLVAKQAFQYSVTNCYTDYIETVVSNNNSVFRITQVYVGEEPDVSDYKEITNDILASFRFVE